MKVTIDQRQETHGNLKRGLFGGYKESARQKDQYTVWIVSTRIDLSQQERAVLDSRKLWDHILFTTPMSAAHVASFDAETRRMLGPQYLKVGLPMETKISDIFKETPFKKEFYDAVEAGEFARRLETEILPRLKSIIESQGAPSGTKKFEL